MWKPIAAGVAAGVLLITSQLQAAEAEKQYDFGPVQIRVGGQGPTVVLPPTTVVPPSNLPMGNSTDLIDDVQKPGPYWLGVRCEQLSPAMRAQLSLKDDGGLLVVSVADDSPAKKAGLQRHDILLKAGPTPLHALPDLLRAVDAVKEHEMTVTLLRAGKQQEVKVTPAKRPDDLAAETPPRSEDSDWRAFRRWIEGMTPQGEMPPAIRFHVIRPGQLVPPGAALPALPDNLTVSITRHGKEPAKIVVQQGDKHWEVTDKDLDKLPADVRPFVDRMLNPLAAAGMSLMEGMPHMPPMMGMPVLPSPGASANPRELHDLQKQMDRQMNDLHRQMDEIRRQMEQMREGKKE